MSRPAQSWHLLKSITASPMRESALRAEYATLPDEALRGIVNRYENSWFVTKMFDAVFFYGTGAQEYRVAMNVLLKRTQGRHYL